MFLSQHVDIVTPHGGIYYGIVVSEAYLYGIPIVIKPLGRVQRIAQHGYLTGLQESFMTAVAKNSHKQVVRSHPMIVALKAITFEFLDETLLRIGTRRTDVVDMMLLIRPNFHLRLGKPQVIIDG